MLAKVEQNENASSFLNSHKTKGLATQDFVKSGMEALKRINPEKYSI